MRHSTHLLFLSLTSVLLPCVTWATLEDYCNTCESPSYNVICCYVFDTCCSSTVSTILHDEITFSLTTDSASSESTETTVKPLSNGPFHSSESTEQQTTRSTSTSSSHQTTERSNESPTTTQFVTEKETTSDEESTPRESQNERTTERDSYISVDDSATLETIDTESTDDDSDVPSLSSDGDGAASISEQSEGISEDTVSESQSFFTESIQSSRQTQESSPISEEVNTISHDRFRSTFESLPTEDEDERGLPYYNSLLDPEDEARSEM